MFLNDFTSMSETYDLHPAIRRHPERVISFAPAIGTQARRHRRQRVEYRPPFRRRASLLSQGERAFFDVLQRAVAGNYLIFVKVRLEDVLVLPRGATRQRRGWQNRVRQKHLDFVLCDASRVAPVLVIEVDDASHRSAKTQKRDGDKDRILNAAGLPIFRIRAAVSYDALKIADVIERLRLRYFR